MSDNSATPVTFSDDASSGDVLYAEATNDSGSENAVHGYARGNGVGVWGFAELAGAGVLGESVSGNAGRFFQFSGTSATPALLVGAENGNYLLAQFANYSKGSGQDSTALIQLLANAGGTALPWNVAVGGPNNGFGLTAGQFYLEHPVGSVRFLIDGSGRVGIGTTSPATLLHVKDVKNNLNGSLALQTSYSTVGDSQTLSWLDSNGWVVAGIRGRVPAPGAMAFDFLLQPNGGTHGLAAIKNVMSMRGDTGNVGIGTASPNYLLQVGANGAYCNGSTWNPASSIRWKENITPLTEGVETLKKLHPVSFNYKKTPAKRTMGFIAEEVGKVLPTVVDWDTAEPGYAEGYDQTAILALTVEAIKELEKENNTLRERIEVLENKLAAG